ncbi:hypothetical protein [Demequina activiva]|uniref:Integral membrane protein n=1 Tax=Demequina activiva TaxID=1582364 RepID=A0A919Q1Z7_9MICO|nr:hypothetical protein [Demequina activiva]GIG54742.1 hypothetical protein Dac01nite_14940 [Demequina activiva]
MPRQTKAEIEARLHELEAQNARLRAEVEEERERAASSGAVAAPAPAAATERSSRGRAAVAVTLIVVGALLAPVATVAAFGARQLSDTDAFVEELAPLADDPAVQQLVIDEASTAIDEAIGTDALVDNLLGALIDEESRPRLAAASERLGPLLADQARTATRTAVTRVVESDAFPAIWEQTVRITHAQAVGVLEADNDGAVTIDDTGVVELQLEPIIAALKPALVDAGFSLANSIPEIDATIVIAEIPQIAQVRLGYSLLLTVGLVLPWVAIGLLVVGVLGHPRTSRGVLLGGTLLLVEGALLASAISIGGSVVAAAVASQVPTAATNVVYRALTAEVTAVMLAYVLAGVIAIIAGLLAGPGILAVRTRAAGSRTLGRVTGWLDHHGWRSQRVAEALRLHAWVLWVVLAAAFVILAATLRPLSPGDVVLGGAVLAVLSVVFAILRGPAEHPRAEAPATVAEPDPTISI